MNELADLSKHPRHPLTPSASAAERRYVSPLQVARALGVSETTVKRWVDDNRLPAQRTEGGHRRILVRDVLDYVSQRNWPHVNLPLLLGSQTTTQSVDVPTLSQRYYDSLVTGDAEQARTILIEAHQAGATVPRLADELISPVMARIGHGWACGELDVYEEHRGSQICLSAIQSLKARLEAGGEPPEDRPLALGGGPEFDHYLFANLLIELTFRELGWRVVNIGPNTPFSSFRLALVERKPALLWLSVSYIANVEEFVAGYQSLYDQAVQAGSVVSVGGRALTESIRERLNFTHHGDRLGHLVAFARQVSAGIYR